MKEGGKEGRKLLPRLRTTNTLKHSRVQPTICFPFVARVVCSSLVVELNIPRCVSTSPARRGFDSCSWPATVTPSSRFFDLFSSPPSRIQPFRSHDARLVAIRRARSVDRIEKAVAPSFGTQWPRTAQCPLRMLPSPPSSAACRWTPPPAQSTVPPNALLSSHVLGLGAHPPKKGRNRDSRRSMGKEGAPMT